MENRPPLEAVIFYSLLNREKITLDELMNKIRDLIKSDKFCKLWFPFDRKDVMEFAMCHQKYLSIDYTKEGWVLTKKKQLEDDTYFTEENIDKTFCEPWFEDKELLKAFKKKFM